MKVFENNFKYGTIISNLLHISPNSRIIFFYLKYIHLDLMVFKIHNATVVLTCAIELRFDLIKNSNMQRRFYEQRNKILMA